MEKKSLLNLILPIDFELPVLDDTKIIATEFSRLHSQNFQSLVKPKEILTFIFIPFL